MLRRPPMKQFTRLFLWIFSTPLLLSACGAPPGGRQNQTASSPALDPAALGYDTVASAPPALHNLTATILPDANAISDIEADIAAASQSIVLGIYEFDREDLAQALIAAKNRGVNVQVVEDHSGATRSLNAKIAGELTAAGITVVNATGFSYYHAKYMVIDSSYALIMTCNLTAASFTSNREIIVHVDDPATVSELGTIFAADFAASTPNVPQSTPLVVSPVNSRDEMTGVIDGATSEIWMAFEEFVDTTLANTLIGLVKQGYSVNLILPTKSKMASNATMAATLEAGGVNVRALAKLYPHEKVIVTDTLAYVGSVNLSVTSMGKNREIGIIGDGAFHDAMLAELQADWANATTY